MSPSYAPAAEAAPPASPGAASPSVSPRYIALAGPTASGKTAAALAVAQTRPVEIISVDSALVYRGMDIGTAKPSAAEQAAVVHHLIDIRDPRDSYNAAAFVEDATRLIGQIHARGALPLLVGGTMLYFKALIDGLDPMPAADPAVRAMLETEAAARGWPAMHARLARVDPVTAARLAPQDSQRIQRALEVWHASGQPLSSFHATKKRAPLARGPGLVALFSLEPLQRSWLHQRIDARFDAMLAAGFLDEVQRLRARGDLTPDLPSMRCVGYRQAWEALDAEAAQAGPAATAPQAPAAPSVPSASTAPCRTGPRAALPESPSRLTHRQPPMPPHERLSPSGLATLRERGTAATRQLAKRQLTWLRSLPERHVIAADAPDATQQVVRAIEQALHREPTLATRSP